MSIFSKIKNLFTGSKESEPVNPEPIEKIEEFNESQEGATPTPKRKPRAKKETDKNLFPEIPTLREAFRLKYPDHLFILDYFTAAANCPATWENLTGARLRQFVAYLSERYAPNSVNQYAIRLKAVMNQYSDDVPLPRGFAKILTPKKVVSTSIYLNEEELRRIQAYPPDNDRERYVKHMFLCSAYCGARVSDIHNLNESNIRGDKLVFIARKTKKEAVIPLKPIVAEYIRNTERVEISDVSYNSIIRKICRKCGIVERVKIYKAGKESEMEKWEAVSSHTARRSFASNLYLHGVDIYTISRLLQHSDIKLTEGYICSGIRKLEEKEMEYFS